MQHGPRTGAGAAHQLHISHKGKMQTPCLERQPPASRAAQAAPRFYRERWPPHAGTVLQQNGSSNHKTGDS